MAVTPARCAPRISTSGVSPVITTRCGGTPTECSASRNIGANGFPTTTGSCPEPMRIASTRAPTAIIGPSGEGNVLSMFVATKRAPFLMEPAALRIVARVAASSQPTTTASQSVSPAGRIPAISTSL
jgi:hypothetical protein